MPHPMMGNTGQKNPAPVIVQITTRNPLISGMCLSNDDVHEGHLVPVLIVKLFHRHHYAAGHVARVGNEVE